MNRKIEFRGWCEDEKRWVYGDLVQNPAYTKPIVYDYEPPDTAHLVEPESVGQFTGFTDAKGRRIYEGDIIKNISKWRIDYSSGCFFMQNLEYENGRYPMFTGFYYKPKFVVVGNIYEETHELNKKEQQ